MERFYFMRQVTPSSSFPHPFSCQAHSILSSSRFNAILTTPLDIIGNNLHYSVSPFKKGNECILQSQHHVASSRLCVHLLLVSICWSLIGINIKVTSTCMVCYIHEYLLYVGDKITTKSEGKKQQQRIGNTKTIRNIITRIEWRVYKSKIT